MDSMHMQHTRNLGLPASEIYRGRLRLGPSGAKGWTHGVRANVVVDKFQDGLEILPDRVCEGDGVLGQRGGGLRSRNVRNRLPLLRDGLRVGNDYLRPHSG
jgi:hypothetical protein